MNKIKLFGVISIFAISMLCSNDANARRNSGNYIGSDGCLHVWESTTFLGITWSYSETVFCNSDGMPFNNG